MGIHFRQNNYPIFILPAFLKGVNPKRKEFAPLGANSFLSELTPFLRWFNCPPKYMSSENTEVVPLCQNGKTNMEIYPYNVTLKAPITTAADDIHKYFFRENNPVGICCQNDVVSTLMRRHHVPSSLIRRHFITKCPLGRLDV